MTGAIRMVRGRLVLCASVSEQFLKLRIGD